MESDTGTPDVTLTVNFEEAQDLSMSIIDSFAENNINVGLGTAACGLVLGHLLCPDELDDERAIKFVEWLLQNAGMYWAEGSVN